MRRLPSAAAALLVGLSIAPPAAADERLPIGRGSDLVVELEPFRVAVETRGETDVATVAAAEGPPVLIPGIDGPLPADPVAPAGSFPALGFVYGAAPGTSTSGRCSPIGATRG